MMSDSLTPGQLACLIESLKKRYGKLWPLHTFNACNPLVAYENLPFSDALKQAESDMAFSCRRAMGIFKHLYARRDFTHRDIHQALEKLYARQRSKNLTAGSKTLLYSEVLEQELLCRLSPQESGDNSQFWATEQGRLLNERVENYTKEQQGQLSFSTTISEGQMLWINEQSTKWLAAYLDQGQSIWRMPGKEKPFRDAWSKLVIHDNQLAKSARKQIQQLVSQCISPEHSGLDSLKNLLSAKSIDSREAEFLLDLHLKEMPGWVGYIEFSVQNQACEEDLLTDYLMMRLMYHFACSQSHQQSFRKDSAVDDNTGLRYRFNVLRGINDLKALSLDDCAAVFLDHFDEWVDYHHSFPENEQLLVLIEALESSQRLPLIQVLNREYAQAGPSKNRPHSEPDAQVVFCIDVRSEPYRKALEESGNIETYGFAGFFGLPIAKVAYASHEAVPLCPILLEPQFIIPEQPSHFGEGNLVSKIIRAAIPLRQQWIYCLKKIKRDTFATFTYVEGLGLVHAFTLFRDSFAGVAAGQLRNRVSKLFLPLADLMPQLEVDSAAGQPNSCGIPLPTQVEFAKSILPLIGLNQPYAEFVIVCGHTAQTRNNPYASALDCGACGSNGGGFNALVLCQILNHPSVREALNVEGIYIPEKTRFIAAEHNTTTDEVSFLNMDTISKQQQKHFMPIQKAFENATMVNRAQRQQKLRAHAAVSWGRNSLLAAYDWSQTRPEWGLSKNQAFIIGDREVTKTIDLGGRCFLHSYDWQSDPDGKILTVIMTAPMVVGTWINLQYGFSTLDQHRFGSGKKYLHNIVGLFGSYLGNASDLQVGLPYESLFSNDGAPYHYPQRLLVYIQAPLERIQSIIEQNESVRNLVENRWIKLMVFDSQKNQAYEYAAKNWEVSRLCQDDNRSNESEPVADVR